MAGVVIVPADLPEGEEVDMHNHENDAMEFTKLDVYKAARELAIAVYASKIGDVELRDQATRASKSVVLNLAEGLPLRTVGDRRRHFASALGSVHEVVAAIDLADAIGTIEPGAAAPILRTASRVAMMLRRLPR